MGANLCAGAKLPKELLEQQQIEFLIEGNDGAVAKIPRNKYSSRVMMHKGDYLSPKSTRQFNTHQFTEDTYETTKDAITQGSVTNSDPRIVICSTDIPCFKTFTNEVVNLYENVNYNFINDIR